MNDVDDANLDLAVRVVARAAYIAMQENKDWAARTWDAMGGTTPSAERAEIEHTVRIKLASLIHSFITDDWES